jgi:hypothetical protein
MDSTPAYRPYSTGRPAMLAKARAVGMNIAHTDSDATESPVSHFFR